MAQPQIDEPITPKLSTARLLAAVASALVVAVLIWWPLAMQIPGFLPTPLDVVRAFLQAIASAELYDNMVATLRRVAIGWVCSVFLGSALGVAMGRSKVVDSFALPWVMIGLAIPAPVIIIFCILFFGIEESSTLLALIISVTPFVVNIVFEGVRSTDPGLIEMSEVYGLSRRLRLREVILPQIAPSLMAGVRFGFAMSWKIVVIIEALSQNTGIGAQLELFFKLLRPDSVLAWTLSFTVIMVLVELLVFRTAEARLFRWQRTAEN